MELKLNKCEAMRDWYTVIRAEHDGESWMEKVDGGFRLMMSERLSPEACIEGDAYEMKEIAKAIRERQEKSFKRIAVSFQPDGVHFHSPKNSEHHAVVTIEEAEHLADQIEQEFKE